LYAWSQSDDIELLSLRQCVLSRISKLWVKSNQIRVFCKFFKFEYNGIFLNRILIYNRVVALLKNMKTSDTETTVREIVSHCLSFHSSSIVPYGLNALSYTAFLHLQMRSCIDIGGNFYDHDKSFQEAILLNYFCPKKTKLASNTLAERFSYFAEIIAKS